MEKGQIRTMQLPVQLKPAEVNIRSRELADVVEEQRQAEERLENLTQGFKGAKESAVEEIEAFNARARKLSVVVRSGQEYRDVEVVDEIVAKDNVVNTVRLDTNVVVGTRSMTDAERQRALFNAKGQPASDAKKKSKPEDAKDAIDQEAADKVRAAAEKKA